MQTKVQTWGNSLGARIPAPFAVQLRLKNNSPVDIRLEGDKIIITPLKRYRRYTLDELVNDITPDNRQNETDWGKAEGLEAW